MSLELVDGIEWANTVEVEGVKYELRKNLSHTHCRGCALKYKSVKDCHKYYADGYVLQKTKEAKK
jgi:hypothetical protein